LRVLHTRKHLKCGAFSHETINHNGEKMPETVGQPVEEEIPNCDENKIKPYQLPDPLHFIDGRPVTVAQDWPERRQEILRLFEQTLYGATPNLAVETRCEVWSVDTKALHGKATRKQARLVFSAAARTLQLDLLLYLPNTRPRPAPIFVGLNFSGNHAIQTDAAIALAKAWMAEGPGVVDHHATELTRGVESRRWPVERILERGYAVATAYYGDLDPDYDDGFQNGVQPLAYQADQTRPGADEWGSIGAWAWGLSRIMDYLQTDPDVDAGRVSLLGHSRLGKTALWAGAQDERFALVISNDSGCGGAALSRRNFGETVASITRAFPHWFCDNFKAYGQRVQDLPVDQHMLVALIAPRPVYIASAEEDVWADPRGEFLSAYHASPVYHLLGLDGLAAEGMPGVEQPILSRIGYHIRRGGHDVTLYDWDRFMDFADRYLNVHGDD
jgi:hypothetical protein